MHQIKTIPILSVTVDFIFQTNVEMQAHLITGMIL